MELVSQSEYARGRNLARSTIVRQIASGVILTHGDRQMVNPEEADLRRAECLNPLKGAKRGLRALQPEERQDPAVSDSEYFFLCGGVSLTHALHHPKRIECLIELALDCQALNLTPEQAVGVGRLSSLLLAVWLRDYFAEWPGGDSIPQVQAFLREAGPEADWCDRLLATGEEEPLPEIFKPENQRRKKDVQKKR